MSKYACLLRWFLFFTSLVLDGEVRAKPPPYLDHSKSASVEQPALDIPALPVLPTSFPFLQLPKELIFNVADYLPPHDLVKLRSASKQFQPRQPLGLDVRVEELYIRQYPLLNSRNPYALYRFCIQEYSVVSSLFPSISECLTAVDKDYGVWLAHLDDTQPYPSLNHVRIQTLYDLNAIHPRISVLIASERLALVKFLIKQIASWTPAQRRAVLFHVMHHGNSATTKLIWQQFCMRRGRFALVPLSECLQGAFVFEMFSGLSREEVLGFLGIESLKAAYEFEAAHYVQVHEKLCSLTFENGGGGGGFTEALFKILKHVGNVHHLCAANDPIIAESVLDDEEASDPVIRLSVLEKAFDLPELWLLTIERHREIILELVDFAANMNEVFHCGGSPVLNILNAMADGAWGIEPPRLLPDVEFMIRFGALANDRHRLGMTCLTYALSAGRPDVTKILLQHGADPNAPGPDPGLVYPLFFASTRGEVLLLAEFGANMSVISHSGRNAVMLAARNGHLEVVDVLTSPPFSLSVDDQEPENGFTALMFGGDNCAMAELLLDRGADPNIRCSSGHTALTLAKNDFEITRLLLQSGADPNIPDGEGNTALHSAIWIAHYFFERPETVDMIRLLLNYGADPSLSNPINVSPLLWCRMYDPRLYRLLLSEISKG